MNPSRQLDSISLARKVFQPWRAIRKSCAVLCVTGSLLLALGAGQTARGFTAADRDLAWQSYKNTFYFTYTDSKGARAYFRGKEGDPNSTASATSFWQFAEQIEMTKDSGDVTMHALGHHESASSPIPPASSHAAAIRRCGLFIVVAFLKATLLIG